jgi:GntR family transcriptional regulator/MocR family aminotransferase
MELALNLDMNAMQPLHHQLYQELRRSILTGRLGAGQRIPSTRVLAKSLGVSRATVTLSYEQLISEGYLETIVGSGTSVSPQLPDELLQAPSISVARHTTIKTSAQPKLSTVGASLARLVREPDEPPLLFNFRYCRPAVDHFPLEQWRRLLLRHCRSGRHDVLEYADNAKGSPLLRRAIARYLAHSRAVNCTADQILIVNGSQQALQLCAQILVNRDDLVAVEEPGYLGARQAFVTYGARLHPVPVDESGIRLDALPDKPARLLYVTPSHQFPTGAVLSLPRRLELLAWAERSASLIIEDDYDSEFRYDARPIPSLQGLAQHENVLYVGTFSKVLFPSLRIGYIVVPSTLVSVFEKAKWLMDRHSPTLEQRALADFINDGHLERHLRRMRKLYDRRRQKLVAALQTHFAGGVTILGENSGMHLMIRLRTSWNSEEVVKRSAAAGVGLLSAQMYYLRHAPGDEFVLGYAALGERKIQEGIRRMAKALHSAK